jgi:hypothetical protein
MERYLRGRGTQPGPLFVTKEGKEVRKTSFAKTLHKGCKLLNLDTSKIKSHSFRIGAATWAMQSGCSDSQIRAMGRWKSSAFLKYIRPIV